MKCAIENCDAHPSVFLLEVQNRTYGKELRLCDNHAQMSRPFIDRTSRRFSPSKEFRLSGQINFDIEFIAAFEAYNWSARIYLREVSGNTCLTFDCGPYESYVLMTALKGETYERPWTFAAIHLIVGALGGTLDAVVVDDVDDSGCFHANLQMRQGDHAISVDLRPTDGLALAIVADVPFLVDDDVVAKVGY